MQHLIKKNNLVKGISIEVPDFSSKLQKHSFNSCPSICSPHGRSLPCPFHLSCWWLLPVSGLHVSHLGGGEEFLPGQWWRSGSHRRLFCDDWHHPLHWRSRSAKAKQKLIDAEMKIHTYNLTLYGPNYFFFRRFSGHNLR